MVLSTQEVQKLRTGLESIMYSHIQGLDFADGSWDQMLKDVWEDVTCLKSLAYGVEILFRILLQ